MFCVIPGTRFTHGAILRVNKQINAEPTQALLAENTFVKVSLYTLVSLIPELEKSKAIKEMRIQRSADGRCH
jgi:hypothetical protein